MIVGHIKMDEFQRLFAVEKYWFNEMFKPKLNQKWWIFINLEERLDWIISRLSAG